MADLTLWTNPMSRGRIARWMLEEIGHPYETVLVNYGPDMKGGDYRAVNPMGKVPAVRHGEVVVTECAAICAYLADAFPDAGLAPPPGSTARGAWYRWLFFGAGPVEAAVTNRSLGVEVPPEKSGFVGYGSYGAVLDTLEQTVAQANDSAGWLAGDAFTSADLYIGAHLSWGLQFKSIEAREPFAAFVERVTARPAHRRATALDDADMAKVQQPG